MKGIIVVDIPEKCKVCRFYYAAREMHTGKYAGGCRIISTMMVRDTEKKPDWCPINPVPDKVSEIDELMFVPSRYADGYMDGWNDCIDKILKGEENE